MIFENLKKSYEGNIVARANMHSASCLAGMTFSNALLGIMRSMSPKTGAVYKSGYIVHGSANAIYLPIHKIREHNVSMGISLSIKDYENSRISEEEFVSRLSEVASNANSDAYTLSNPRKSTQLEMEKLLLACIYEREVDF